MLRKLHLVLATLILTCGISLVAGHSAYGQATVVIDQIRNSCGTQNNGSFRITVTAGTAPFSVLVVSPSTGYFINVPLTLGVPEIIGVAPPAEDTGLPPDNNILVAVSDGDPAPNYSTNISILSIPEITGIATTEVDNSDNTCVAPNGSITINTINGGSGSYNFSWTGPSGFTATTQNLANLGGGDYVVNISDQTSNCSFTSSPITIEDPVPNSFTISSPDLTPCADADFTVDISPAETGVEYRLYIDGNPTATAVTGPTASLVHSGISSGAHTISVSATRGLCASIFGTNTLSFQMNEPPASAVLGGSTTICKGEGADISIAITGGTAPYSFTIDNGVGLITGYASGSPIAVTPAATTTYAFVGDVTDANGCSVAGTGNAIITVNPLPTAAVSGGGSVCAGSALPPVTFTFTGTAPFDFTYTDGTTPVTITDHNSTTFTISNAPTGTYSLTALSDNNGCTGTSLGTPVAVTENPLPTAAVSGGGTVCAGDVLPDVTLTFTGTPPFDFTYTDGATPVTVNDHNSMTFTITEAPAGTYSVTALSDNNGCAGSSLGTPVVVVENPLPTAAVSGGGTVCAGDVLPDVTLTFTGAPPFDFTYTDGATSVTVNDHNSTTFTIVKAPTGTYSVTALSDINGCTATSLGSPVAVAENPLPTATASGGGTVCAGDVLPDVTLTFTGTPPFDFTYTDGATSVTVNDHNSMTFTITQAPTGSYSVTALSDNNGCSGTSLGSPVMVVENPLPTAAVSGGGAVCAGDVLPDVTLTFTGTAPFDFAYTDGTASVTVTDHGSTTFTITAAPEGTYSVTALTDATGCSATDFGGSVVVSEDPRATAEAGNPQSICPSDAATLSGSSIGGAASTGAWSIFSQPAGGDGLLSDMSQTATPATVTFTATVAGDYTLRLTTDDPANACGPATDDVVIKVFPVATADAGPPQTICVSGKATLAGSSTGATGITWTTSGNGSFDNATLPNAVYTPGPSDKATGTVTLTLTTVAPCAPVSDDVVITINPDPTVEAGLPQTICSSSDVTLSGSFGGSATGLVWSTGGDGIFDDNTDAFATYTPGTTDKANGSVMLVATATGSCAGTSDNVTITLRPEATVEAGDPQTICFGSKVVLDGTSGGSASSVTWSTSGDGSFDNATNPDAVYTPGTNDQTTGKVTLTLKTNNPPGPCPAVSDDVEMSFMAIPGDQATAGNETWIGYVYDDAGDPDPIPGKIDFDNAKYRGFINESDIGTMSAASTYDAGTDAFDLNLGLTGFINGANVCGTYLNTFSVRYKMDKTFAAGVYRFTAGADDGVRLLIDGVDVLPASAFDFQSYTTYTSSAICLTAGVHQLEIHYFDNTAQSRLTFAYEQVPPLSTPSSVAVCRNDPAPQLTASSTDPEVAGFNWYKGGTLVFTGASYTPAPSELDMATAGNTTFEVTAVYACGETQPTPVVVSVVSSAALAINPETICESAGPVDLRTPVTPSPAGGTFVFSGHPNISGNNFDPAGLAGTTVTISVDYSVGSCTAPTGTLDLTITNSAAITVPPSPVALCESAPDVDLTTLVSASPSGGTFAFSGPQVTGNLFDPSGLSGPQTITVDYGVGGCSAPQQTFQVDVKTTASLTVTNASTCKNGSSVNLLGLVSGTPAGGVFTFTGPGVSGSAFDPSGQSGTVNIDVAYDANGCTANGTIQLTVLNASDPVCTGGNCSSVVIVPKPQPATCTNSDGSITFSIKPFTPAINNTGIKITIDGVSSTNLSISRTIYNDTVFNALPVGTYNYSIEYGDPSCIKSGTVTIDQSGTVAAPVASNVTGPVCPGSATGSLTVDVPGETGNILEWSLDAGLTDPFKQFTAGQMITGIPAGPAPTFEQVISVRRNISDPCYASVRVVMAESVSPISATFSISPATCNGNDGAIHSIVASGGNGAPYTFSINGGQSFQSQTDFNGLAGGSYSLRVRDAGGCERDLQADVTFPGFINFGITKKDADCTNSGNSGSISVVIDDPGVFEVALASDAVTPPADSAYRPYSNPSIVFPDLPRGQYVIYVQSTGGGCPTRSAPIDVFGVYAVDFDMEPDCKDNELSIALVNVTGDPGGAPIEIHVSRKLTSDPPEIIYKQFPSDGEVYLDYDQYTFLKTPAEYRIKIIQFQNEVVCNLSSKSVDLTVPEPLSAQAGAVSESYPDVPTGTMDITAFSGGIAPYNVRIDLDSASSFALPAYSTDFEEAGLNDRQEFDMSYEKIPAGRYLVEIVDSLGCAVDLVVRVPLDEDLFIPNVFTPNGDGSNEVFFIRNLPSEPSVNQLIISNRWGKEVFVSQNYQNNWDGAGVADGLYFYRLKIQDGDPITGWVEIMRGPKP